MYYRTVKMRSIARIASLFVLSLMLGGCSWCGGKKGGGDTGTPVAPAPQPPVTVGPVPAIPDGDNTAALPSRLDANTPVREGEMKRVYFDYDKSAIRADQLATLDANAQYLLDKPRLRIIIEGHCDERGTQEYNLNLGQKRAMSVIDYLVKKGVAPDRLYPISYGKERPEDLGHTEAAWAKNRRCVFMEPIAK
ncbi:MAG: peptidoglycan-associated lipoprotein Pal [Candidatus Sumerlaeota bacterium]|nr:peptidoglycan-associated lipoprotein Pal [Candidatus Sumerlaeota bacterium]